MRSSIGKHSVGADAPVRPSGLHRISYNVSLRSQCAHWLWQSASPVPKAPLPKGGWHGEAVTGGFLTAFLVTLRRGDPCGRPREGRSPSPTHHKIRFRRGRCLHRPASPHSLQPVIPRPVRTLVVGSEPSAAGGRGSEVSEWPRSKFPASAVRQHRNFGHRNRVIRNTLAQIQRGTDCHNQ